MTEIEAAFVELAEALESSRVGYVLIGGLAVALSGEPRATLDVDISVWVDPERLNETVLFLANRFRSRSTQPLEFVARHRVLPLLTSNGIRADIVFGAIPFEREIVERAVLKVAGGKRLPVASIEDLVLMKIISTREKDLNDARALLRRYRDSLDREYLFPKLTEIAEGLDRPDILRIFESEANVDP